MASVLAGAVAAFVVAIELIGWCRPPLLLDPEPSWAAARLLLGLSVVGGAAAVGGLAAGALLFWSRTSLARRPLEPLPLSASALALLAVSAVLLGTLLRFVALERLPNVLWLDDVSLIAPTLEFRGEVSDFRDAVRPAPYGVPRPYGSVGVLYLTTVTAVAAAAVSLWLVQIALPAHRRAGALAVIGLVAVSGMLWARDALLRWRQRQETLDGFHGADTLIGRAAARWEGFGHVEIEAGLGHSFITIGAVRRYRLDPDRTVLTIARRQSSFRLVAPGTAPMPGERTVERVRDEWRKECRSSERGGRPSVEI